MAYDGMNNLFNLAYEILAWKIHKALVRAKLEPYLGFLHSNQTGKMSLICDFQELYRYCARGSLSVQRVAHQGLRPKFDAHHRDLLRRASQPLGAGAEGRQLRIQRLHANGRRDDVGKHESP